MAIQISGTTVINNSRNLVNAGTGSFSGTVSVATPTASGHAATKSYIDGLANGGGVILWANWNAQGTVSVRDSYNVNSIGDLNTGRFRVNFSDAAANNLYAMSGMCGNTSNNTSGTQTEMCLLGGGQGTSSVFNDRFDVLTGFSDNNSVDYPQNHITVFGSP